MPIVKKSPVEYYIASFWPGCKYRYILGCSDHKDTIDCCILSQNLFYIIKAEYLVKAIQNNRVVF